MSEVSVQRYALHAGDVLIPQNRRPLEATVLDSSQEGFLVGPNIVVVRLEDTRFDPYTLATVMTSAAYHPIVEKLSAGSATKNLSLSHLASIPIPSMDEPLQQRIRELVLLAHRLEHEISEWKLAATSLLDRVIEQQTQVEQRE